MNPLRVVSYYDSTIYRVDEEKLKEYNHEAVIFVIAIILALARSIDEFSDKHKPYLLLFVVFLTALYFILWFIRKVRLESNKKYQIEVGRKEKAIAVVFTFFDYRLEGIFSAITCEKATYPNAVKSELEAIPKGYSVIKEMIYPYESIEKITLKDDKYLITVFDDSFVICKEDCNYDLVNFLNDLIERTGK